MPTTRKVRPTAKQRKAFTFLSENIRNPNPKPMGELLIGAGYTIAVSKRPSQVTESKGFLELLEEHLPDDKVLSVHKQLLDDKDARVKLGAVKLAYSVKGKIADGADKPKGDTYNTFIQQNAINPNAPEAKALIDDMLTHVMEKTKRKIVPSSVKTDVDKT